MLWIKLKPGETIDVLDEQGKRVGVLHAEQRAHSIRLGFDGLKQLVLKRRDKRRPDRLCGEGSGGR